MNIADIMMKQYGVDITGARQPQQPQVQQQPQVATPAPLTRESLANMIGYTPLTRDTLAQTLNGGAALAALFSPRKTNTMPAGMPEIPYNVRMLAKNVGGLTDAQINEDWARSWQRKNGGK